MTMHRRQFIQLSATAVLASLAGAACADDDDLPDATQLAHPAVVDILGPDRARELGVHYRQMVKKESDARALRRAIASSGRGWLRLPWARRPSLAELVRDDFAEGRTVLVDGWVLSRTEARQCALLSLAST